MMAAAVQLIQATRWGSNMRTSIKRFLVALATAMVAAVAASPASAVTFDPWFLEADSSSLVLLSEGGLINPAITCSVDLFGYIDEERSFDEGDVIGDIDISTVHQCTGGTARFALTGFWDLRFVEIDLISETWGHLTLRIHDVHFTVVVSGVTCEFGGTLDLIFDVSGRPLIGWIAETSRGLTLVDVGGSFLCPPRAGFSGTFTTNFLTLVL
jgi:hypothetical protein